LRGVHTFVVPITRRKSSPRRDPGSPSSPTGSRAPSNKAKAVAGGKKVSIGGGADIALQRIRAGLVDEIQIHLAPLLLGAGVRLFGNIGPEPIDLEQVRVIDTPGITGLKYRVAKETPGDENG
jgi:dihydrofolate reductase